MSAVRSSGVFDRAACSIERRVRSSHFLTDRVSYSIDESSYSNQKYCCSIGFRRKKKLN
ncbi:hypothetical protein HanRHA438_Chr14g0645561 [Helianthus annuus]|nr:hypothetical protein HanRHA438_Chr14g0645561 [Helianthus annuus]